MNGKSMLSMIDLVYLQMSGDYLFDDIWYGSRLDNLNSDLESILLTEREREFLIHCKELEEKRQSVMSEFEKIKSEICGEYK